MTQHQNQPRQPFAQDSEQEWSPGESIAPENATSMGAVQRAANESPQVQQLKALQAGANAHNRTFQLKASAGFPESENNTGMPDQLKAGVEGLSGMDLNDVKVHYNSDKPAQLQAHAYAQGNEIHLGPGQEEHLPHEAWHVAQQKQGRVSANTTSKSGTPVNDNPGLEQEADAMGAKAMQFKSGEQAGKPLQKKAVGGRVAQLVKISEEAVNGIFNWVGDAQMKKFTAFDKFRKKHREGNYINYKGGDPEVDSMLWVTTEAPYADWAPDLRRIAWDALAPFYSTESLNVLASTLKSFFHLWKRHEVNPAYGKNNELIKEAVIGGLMCLNISIKYEQDPEDNEKARAREFGESNLKDNQPDNSAEDFEEKTVKSLAAGGDLKFKNLAAAVTHYLKHGSFFNNGEKELGNLVISQTEESFLAYLREANFVVARGECKKLQSASKGVTVFKFSHANCFAVVSCTKEGGATLLSYYPHELQVFTNEISNEMKAAPPLPDQSEMRMEMPD